MMFKNREKDKVSSLIGPGCSFKGEINVKGMLRVDGIFEGTVVADSIVVGEKGSIKGDIAVKTANIGGTVDGNIRADEFLEIEAKGSVNGDIYAGKISIIEGGIYNGRITMGKTTTKIVEFSSKDG